MQTAVMMTVNHWESFQSDKVLVCEVEVITKSVLSVYATVSTCDFFKLVQGF